MLGNLGMGEILVILLIVLLLFGAKRIPEIAGSMGKGISEFKRSVSDTQRAITEPERPRTERLADEPRAARADDETPEPKRLIS